MPRYDFTCEACKQTEEVYLPFAAFESPRPCSACGGAAHNQITGGTAVMVRGFAEYHFRPDKAIVGHSGLRLGRSAEAQVRGHKKHLGLYQKRVKDVKSVTKDGWEMLGAMPTEMHDAICKHEGDKNAVMSDPVPFLKATGTYTGRDKK